MVLSGLTLSASNTTISSTAEVKIPVSPKGNKMSKMISAPVPKTRDPFINTPLISLGKDCEGVERFWISSWNGNVGCLGVLVSETGESRVYRFAKKHDCFYSACGVSPDTLWLCGSLERLVRLDLSTGKTEVFPTEAPGALVFRGMIFDPKSKKLFALATPWRHPVTAFSFDAGSGKTVKLHTGVTTDHYPRFSFPNGDGTHTMLVQVPGQSLLRWDPIKETVTCRNVEGNNDVKPYTNALIRDEKGRVYFPNKGWYDPLKDRFLKIGKEPEREMTWFASFSDRAYGANARENDSIVSVWDFKSGNVTDVCSVPDCPAVALNATEKGEIIAVNMYGFFHRFDNEGNLEICNKLPTSQAGKIDCLCRIDENRLLGTPFISQRFWEVNIKTGKGADCGRAAPGPGEILRACEVGRKVYMAAYVGGELMEYDPREAARYPENPYVAAKPPGGHRPVAMCEDGRHVFYSCTRPKGTLGSVLTRYDTRSGEVVYSEDPLPDHMIITLRHDRPSGKILASTSINADCESCPPAAERAMLAVINPATLEVENKREAIDPDTVRLPSPGTLAKGKHFFMYDPYYHTPDEAPTEEIRYYEVALDNLEMTPLRKSVPLAKFEDIKYAGKPGQFYVKRGAKIELWNFRSGKFVKTICEGVRSYRYFAMNGWLYFCYPKRIDMMRVK